MHTLRKESQNEEISRRWSEEHDTVRMPDIIFVMCSFKTQFILYSLIYLCLCMPVCGHAYLHFIYICGFTYYNLICDVAKFMAENGRGNGNIKRKKTTDTKAPGNSLRHGKVQKAFCHYSAPDQA